MKNALELRGYTVAVFKKKYPRLYKKIIGIYGGRIAVVDPQAAVCLYLNHEARPVCSVCNIPLTITKKCRMPQVKHRCSLHVNIKDIITIETLAANNPHGYEIMHVPKNASKSSYMQLKCAKHGEYSQPVKNFLKGMRCQKCYGETILPSITAAVWLARCMAQHNSYYHYTNSQFTDINSNVEVECPVHGVYTQNAGVHMRGFGCRKCSTTSTALVLTLTTEEFVERAVNIHDAKYNYDASIYKSAREHIDITCPTHGVFSQVAYYHLAGNGCPTCGIQQTTRKSAAEYEIINFLKSHGITNIVHSWRGLGFEIDIYLPDYHLAIEYNGIYWHSSSSKDTDVKISKQHLMKTIACEQNNIQLLHILDIEWNDLIQKKIWKSTIEHHIGLTANRIFARSCAIVVVGGKFTKQFFDDNHLQKAVVGAVNIGLVHAGQLVSLATFGKSRFKKGDNCYELLRFATVVNTVVIGGFSKIIKEFNRTHTGILVSYANRRWSKGNVYAQCGFTLTHTTDPCYYYTNCKSLWHRVHFQKSKLSTLLNEFDPNKTEIENMYMNKYRRIWDCGQMVYQMKLDKGNE